LADFGFQLGHQIDHRAQGLGIARRRRRPAPAYQNFACLAEHRRFDFCAAEIDPYTHLRPQR